MLSKYHLFISNMLLNFIMQTACETFIILVIGQMRKQKAGQVMNLAWRDTMENWHGEDLKL